MDKSQQIKTETEALLSRMINKFEVEVTEDDGAYYIVIKAEEEAPTVIGRHGETIRAIQKILEVIMYKSLGDSVALLVNVNDYREKQKERLESLASELVEKSRSLEKPMYFRGLSSYERKMIHEYVTENFPEMTTYSVGEGRERQLVIAKKDDKQPEESESKTE